MQRLGVMPAPRPEAPRPGGSESWTRPAQVAVVGDIEPEELESLALRYLGTVAARPGVRAANAAIRA